MARRSQNLWPCGLRQLRASSPKCHMFTSIAGIFRNLLFGMLCSVSRPTARGRCCKTGKVLWKIFLKAGVPFKHDDPERGSPVLGSLSPARVQCHGWEGNPPLPSEAPELEGVLRLRGARVAMGVRELPSSSTELFLCVSPEEINHAPKGLGHWIWGSRDEGPGIQVTRTLPGGAWGKRLGANRKLNLCRPPKPEETSSNEVQLDLLPPA